jgi:hypothetical protein
MMAVKPTPASIAAALTVPERILLFCLASDTDWQAASITHATAQHMMVRGLIERDNSWRRSGLDTARFARTDQAGPRGRWGRHRKADHRQLRLRRFSRHPVARA